MIRRRLLRSSALLATSFFSILPHGAVKSQEGDLSKRLRESILSPSTNPPTTSGVGTPPRSPQEKFPWRTNIVTTTFWVGERATKNNPVPNHASSWDPKWALSYGGFDTPVREERANFLPASFTPGQNPFYIALPYNDTTKGTNKPEASLVIPWFKEAYTAPGKSVCKGRWIAIRFGTRVCYAQWEDCGPFRTDHWQYVFGNERPKPNLNKGAGLDVSPAVRDYLGMNDTDVTDWKFVDFKDVPQGPWSLHGDNNTFVQNARAHQGGTAVVSAKRTPEVGNAATNGVANSPEFVNGQPSLFQPIR